MPAAIGPEHTDLYHLSGRCDFSLNNNGLTAHILIKLLMALDEGVLWFLSPLFCRLYIDGVCPQGPVGMCLTEIIKSKLFFPVKEDAFDMIIGFLGGFFGFFCGTCG